MKTIQSELEKILNNYLSEKITFGRVSIEALTYKLLSSDLPKLFKDNASIPSGYIVKGSAGQLNFNFAGIPWICFFDNEITNSAQRGYYVCLLFRQDMGGFYLSLNQGWTQYEKKYGVKAGANEIEINSIKARQLLRSTKGFESKPIDLKATTDLGKGYERGNIYSYYYPATSLPNDKKLIEDLQQLLGTHRELKGLVGNNILNIKSLGSEEDFQEIAQSTKKANLPAGPINKSEKKERTSSFSWPRDPAVSRIALEKANFKCEFDESHNTFISKSSGNHFVEVHHLIPMEKQNDFEYKLDVPENIVALCPNCHRKIHLASKSEKQPLIETLLKRRLEGLNHRGIYINLMQLNEIYEKADLIEY